MTPLLPSSLGRGTSLRALARPAAPEWAVSALASRREPVEKAAAVRKGRIAVEGRTKSCGFGVSYTSGAIQRRRHCEQKKTRRSEGGLRASQLKSTYLAGPLRPQIVRREASRGVELTGGRGSTQREGRGSWEDGEVGQAGVDDLGEDWRMPRW